MASRPTASSRATLEALIAENLVDRVALDYKTRWEGFSSVPGDHAPSSRDNDQNTIRKSIAICKKALREQESANSRS